MAESLASFCGVQVFAGHDDARPIASGPRARQDMCSLLPVQQSLHGTLQMQSHLLVLAGRKVHLVAHAEKTARCTTLAGPSRTTLTGHGRA